MRLALGGVLAIPAMVLACGAPQSNASTNFPPSPPGCEVQLFPEGPNVPTENIGPVSASCEDVVSDDDCMRTLKDQVCKLGGNVAWGVDEKPKLEYGRKKLSGRAARKK